MVATFQLCLPRNVLQITVTEKDGIPLYTSDGQVV